MDGRGGLRPGGFGGDMLQPPDEESSSARKDYERERADHERVKRLQREFALEIQRGEYVSRAGVQQAAATVLAVMAQSLSSLPDNLERQCGLTPQQAEIAQQQVDAALLEMSRGLKAMAG